MFYKAIEGEYIVAVGIGENGVEITETEYNLILNVVNSKPPRTDATDYLLRTDLTWEEIEVQPEPEPEPSADELIEIILGGTP